MSYANPKDRLQQAQGKAPLEYLEPVADAPIARVMKHGGDKYGIRNYTVEPISARVYVGAIRRHLNALAAGEDVDPDSGEHHLAHIGANVHVWLAALEAGTFIDDRDKAEVLKPGVGTPRQYEEGIDPEAPARGCCDPEEAVAAQRTVAAAV